MPEPKPIPWHLIASYVGLLSVATLVITAGSFSTLKRAPSPSARKLRKKSDSASDDSEDEEEIHEVLTSSDAYLFPVLGSGMLLALYAAVKLLDPAWINYLFGLYFALMGVGSVWKTSVAFGEALAGQKRWRSFPKYKLVLMQGRKLHGSLSLRLPTVILGLLSMIPSLAYSLTPSELTKSALLTNILAISFAFTALGLLRLDSFKTGCILLAGLFIYDIWWVFGTEVMVKVAVSLDAPIKILWPKSLVLSPKNGFTMLGLGDIVIPGCFISLCLRYDQHRAPKGQLQGFSKPYFTTALVSYVLGLTTTMSVMHVFGHAQPALLYLSPACILSFMITALRLGEVKTAWAWEDASEEKLIDPKNSSTSEERVADGVDHDTVASVQLKEE